MASEAFQVFLLLKNIMPPADAEKVILFIEDLKDGEQVKTDRMIDIYEIFKKYYLLQVLLNSLNSFMTIGIVGTDCR